MAPNLNVDVNDPAVLQYLMEQGGLTNEVSDLERQQLMATQLRQRSAAPQGRGFGGVYTAANPLEHIVSAAGQIKANKAEEAIGASLKGIGDRRQGALATLAGSLGKKSSRTLDTGDYGGGI